MIKRRQVLFAGLAMLSTAAFAGTLTGTEILFGSASFDDVKAGTTLSYTHKRSADEKIPVRAISDGHIVVNRIDNEDGVVFLESSVSSVTFATKGSPFYIRNRIKDAFASGGEISSGTVEVDGEEIDATHIDYRPFKGDRNAERMGAAFENLLVRFTLSDDVPGHFVEMTTVAKIDETVFFIEEVRFDATEQKEK